MSDPKSPILDLVEALMAARPFTADGVSRLLGVGLAPRPEASNPHFTMHAAAPRPGELVAEADVRIPTAAGRDGFVMITLGGEVDVGKKDVMARFGARPELAVPTPRQPPDAPLYLVYKFGWGDLRFGFARSGREELRTVVVDATEARA